MPQGDDNVQDGEPWSERTSINDQLELLRLTEGRRTDLLTPTVTSSWMIRGALGGVVSCESRQYRRNQQHKKLDAKYQRK